MTEGLVKGELGRRQGQLVVMGSQLVSGSPIHIQTEEPDVGASREEKEIHE